jgi:NAD(P)-dependent dehydrogenase (short-subunit alcohol dehydrogenase family)
LAARVRLGGGEHRQAPHIPMGRTGQPEEVARMMLYLASDDASFCTGGAYMVDGGVSAGRAG